MRGIKTVYEYASSLKDSFTNPTSGLRNATRESAKIDAANR